jgi:hypothetical protein
MCWMQKVEVGTVLNDESGFYMLSKSNLKQIMDHIGTVRMGPEIPDNDFQSSTNLNGAVVRGLSLLEKSSALVVEKIRQEFCQSKMP